MPIRIRRAKKIASVNIGYTTVTPPIVPSLRLRVLDVIVLNN